MEQKKAGEDSAWNSKMLGRILHGTAKCWAGFCTSKWNSKLKIQTCHLLTNVVVEAVGLAMYTNDCIVMMIIIIYSC